MKVKAIVMNKDHTNTPRILSKKERRAKKFSLGDETYFLDSDHFQVTWQRILFWKRQYITYYYRAGSPKPLPVPAFPEYENLGISSEELEAIFNPWFYRVIAPQDPTGKERLMMMLAIGTAALQAYTVYLLSSLPENVADAVQKALFGS